MSLIAQYTLESSLGGLTYQNNSGKLIPSAGKVGNGYRRVTINDGTDFLQSTAMITLANSFTMACWALVTDAGTSANGLVTHHSHGHNAGAGITVKRISEDDYRISCNTGTGTGRTYHTYYGTTNIKNKWAHLVVRYYKPTQELSLWVDGVREFTLTYPMVTRPDYVCIHSWSTTYNQSANYRPAATIDEVKIYDHAMSPLEIYGLSHDLSDLHPMAKNIREIYLQDRVTRIALGKDVLYRAMSELRQIKLSNPTTMFADPTSWSDDATLGLYRDIYNASEAEVVESGFIMKNVRRIEAKFTSYHDVPGVSLGASIIQILLDDDTLIRIGTRDAWATDSQGQNVYRPIDQGGNLVNYVGPIVKFPIFYDVPFNRTVVGILIDSAGFSDEGNDYPFSERGISDIVVTEILP